MALFTIEGGIGSGKTSLLSQLERAKFSLPHIVLYEDVESWRSFKDAEGQDILSLFYKEPEKYSYVFQSYVLFSRMNLILKTIRENPGKIVICERCHLTDLYVFASCLFDRKDLSEMEWQVYGMWHKTLKEMFKIEIKGIIYVKTSPEMCHRRIKKRSRSGEESIPQEYLESLHEKHEEWLTRRPRVRKDVSYFALEEDFCSPVLTLNGDTDFFLDYSERKVQLEEIQRFVNSQL